MINTREAHLRSIERHKKWEKLDRKRKEERIEERERRKQYTQEIKDIVKEKVKEKKRHKRRYKKHKVMYQDRELKRYYEHRKERTKTVRSHYKKLRMLILNKFGNKCVKCGFSDPRALQVDHIHGGGCKDQKSRSNYLGFLKEVLEDTKGRFQVLCANCNWIKRMENHEHRQSEVQ